jgi:ribose transport system substrate-binding protein
MDSRALHLAFARGFFRVGRLCSAALIVLVSFSACGPKRPTDGAEATRTPGSIRSVGLTVGDLSNPFFVQIAKGAESKVKELGGAGVSFTAVSSGYDLNRQANQIDDFIAAKTDLILLNAADSQGVAPAVRKARAAGITVIAIDVSAEGGVHGTVMSDNRQAGELAGDYIVKRLKGTGSVVIINGPPVSAVLDRIAGVEAALAKAPGIRVVSRDQNGQGNRDGGMSVMNDLLVAHPKVDAVFAVNDPTGLGAALALRQARKSGVFIAAVDGAPDAERALADPDHALAATAAQDPFAMAGKAVELGFALRSSTPPAETLVRIPVTLVTRENVSAYRGWTSK